MNVNHKGSLLIQMTEFRVRRESQKTVVPAAVAAAQSDAATLSEFSEMIDMLSCPRASALSFSTHAQEEASVPRDSRFDQSTQSQIIPYPFETEVIRSSCCTPQSGSYLV